MRTGLAAIALLLAASCAERHGTFIRPENDLGSCTNGIDDDGDGVADCDDLSCQVAGACVPGLDAGHPDSGPSPFDAGPLPDGGPGCGPPLDVVFVLDVSTSMADEAEKLRNGIGSIWNAAHALSGNTQLSLIVFVDDALAVNDCAPFDTLDALRGEFDYWRGFCASNLSPVSMIENADCPENSLDAIYLAATTCPWREGAVRVLVHVTDDTFMERPAILSDMPFVQPGVPVQHTYAEVAGALVANQVRMGAFAAPGRGEECGAGHSPNVGQGFHEPYMGMPSLPDASHGEVWSIRDVRSGAIEMNVTINGWIAAEYCAPF